MDLPKLHSPSSAEKLSPEIVCHIARLLHYRDAWIAASVCGVWRAALLADPFLWSYISVHLMEGTSTAWLQTLRTLMKRNAQRALTLELQCDDYNDSGELFNACEVVAAFLAGHMEVIKSLSITIPTCNTKYWHRLLRKRAPLLEVLRVHNNTFMDDTPKLPSQLFGGYAPRLRSVVLEQAYFPHDLAGMSGRALAGVTSLCFHTSGAIQYGDVLERLTSVMPRLEQLTCTVLDEYTVSSYCPLALQLRLNVADGVGAVVSGFPNATSVVYSYAGGHGRRHLGIVDAAIGSVSQQLIMSVGIDWTTPHAKISLEDTSERCLSLSLNGVPVVVDIKLAILREALTSNVIAHFERTVQTLAIVEEMWDLFAAVDMPALRDLALRLSAREDWATAGSPFNGAPLTRQYGLEALRLIGPSDEAARAPGTVVPPVVIANLLRNFAAAGSSPTLYLHGLVMGKDGNDTLGDAAAHIVHPGEPIVESWSWELAKDNVIVPRV